MPRCILFAILTCFALEAQRTGSVQGVVLSTPDRQPVRKAAVTITSVQNRSYAVAITDATGHFTLSGIPKGRYRIQASRSGFLPVAYGAAAPQRPGVTLNLEAGETRTEVQLLLALATSISGTARDSEGDGLGGVHVVFFRKRLERGKARFQQAAAATTDSRGHYEAVGIQPGEYWAATQTAYVPVYRTKPVGILGDTKLEVAAPQIYSGVNRVESAVPITAVAGPETTGIDFHLNSTTMVAVHGTVFGIPEDTGSATVFLEPVSFPGNGFGVVRFAVSSGKPIFQHPGILAGSYRMTVHAGSRRFTSDLQLNAQDTEVNVTLSPGATLTGSVKFEGPSAKIPKRLHISLSPGDEAVPSDIRADVEDGEFEFEEVPAGVWDIGVNPLPSGSYIKSMRLGNRDVLLEDMIIQPDSKGPLDIVISTAAPKVEGTVDPPGPATIVAGPTGKLARSSSFYASAQADETGHFTVSGLNPGTYRFYAFHDVEPDAWQEPSFLAPFETQSKSAELKEGATETLKLAVIGAGHP